MPIDIACPQCRKPLRVADQYAGQVVSCPHCKQAMRTPKPAPPPEHEALLNAIVIEEEEELLTATVIEEEKESLTATVAEDEEEPPRRERRQKNLDWLEDHLIDTNEPQEEEPPRRRRKRDRLEEDIRDLSERQDECD